MPFKVRLHNETVLLHIEVQTHDSRDKPMPLCVLAYAGDLLLRYEFPVYSVVLYLSANAGQTDPGGYSYGDDTFGLQHRYQVIRLAELEAAHIEWHVAEVQIRKEMEFHFVPYTINYLIEVFLRFQINWF